MVKGLLKIFVKDYERTDDPSVRARYGIFAGITGIVLNFILFAVKLVAGILTLSISIIADALNNVTDAGSSAITLAGFRISEKPADSQHPFGHGRMEYVAGFIVSAIILVVGFELCVTSVERLVQPTEVSFGWFSVGVMIASVIIKLLMFAFYRALANRIGSDALKTASLDSLSDSVATLTVLAGILIMRFTNVYLDGYIGIAVSLFILWAGFSSAKKMVDLLLGKAPDKTFIQEIETAVLAHKEVIGIHDIVVHSYGAGRTMVSLHAEVSSEENILELHDSVDLIEMELRQKFGCDAVIHMDPIETDNELIKVMRDKVYDIIRNIDNRLSMHDFRMVRGKTHTNLIFDVVVPFGISIKDKDLTERIKKAVKELDENYYVVLRYDRPYV